MITPSYGLTATERVLPRLALDWTTGLVQTGVDVTRAGVATFVGSNGLIQSASANTQRIDWTSGTPGLLIEEARTNLVAQSEDLSAGAWTKSQTTVSANATISPDGSLSADTLIENTANAIHSVGTVGCAVTSGVAYTQTIYAKFAGRRYLVLTFDSGNFGGTQFSTFDLVNGVVSGSAAATSKIEAGPEGFYRCSHTATSSATNTAFGFFILSNVSTGRLPAYAGDGVSGIHLWGGGIEAGAFPTSYIPTSSLPVTRNADVASMTGTNFIDWYNPTEGTIGILASVPAYSTSSVVQAVQASIFKDLLNYIRLRGYSNGSGNFLWDSTITTAGASVVDFPEFTTTSPNTLVQQLLSYKLNNCANAVNGTTVNVDTSSAIPLTLDTLYIGSLGGTVTGAQHINKINYWPQRLINNEIQAFSK